MSKHELSNYLVAEENGKVIVSVYCKTHNLYYYTVDGVGNTDGAKSIIEKYVESIRQRERV